MEAVKSALDSIVGRLMYLVWRVRHPMAPFSRFYVRMVERRLESGKPHCTLGNRRSDVGWFEDSALTQIGFLKKNGLQPEHRLVDFGCGSLRAGRHLIEYLESGNYIGLDVTDRFYLKGVGSITKSVLERKRPRLAVISDKELSAVAERKPDFIFSFGVLMHVPPKETGVFLGKIASLMKADTLAYISFKEGDRCKRTGFASWQYTRRFLAGEAQKLGATVTVLDDRAGLAPGHRVMVLTRGKDKKAGDKEKG
jgi:hypothetical protein